VFRINILLSYYIENNKMPRHQHHYGLCEHCEGTGIKQFFQNAGRKIKQSFQKGGVMRKVGSEVLNVVKPLARPLINELVNEGADALKVYAPEAAPLINVGSQALQNGISNSLAKRGMGVGRKGRFVKGSAEAKEHMAKIRAMRGKGIGGKNGIRRMSNNVDYIPQPHSRMP
jgi:hypothetical protein